MSRYSYIDLDRIDPGGPGNSVRFVRRQLGTTAFGINHYTLQPGATGRAHDGRESGQQEVLVILAGSGILRVDGEEIDLRPGRFVRLCPADPMPE
jgi:uncharacterized cupin superfamily protein